jgi:hypothetical protein
MSGAARAIEVGQALPQVRLRSGWGADADLAVWRGRPLVIVCIRYYG